MKSVRIATLLIATFLSSVSWAATDCSDNVVSIRADRSSGALRLHVALALGTTIVVDTKEIEWFREVSAMASLAKVAGQSVTARFSESGLRCEKALDRIDLVSFTLGSNETATTKSMSAAPASMAASSATRRP